MILLWFTLVFLWPDISLLTRSQDLISKFQTPTPAQAQAWPILLNRRDLVLRAITGSGKTLAFLFPLLAHVKRILPGFLVGKKKLEIIEVPAYCLRFLPDLKEIGHSPPTSRKYLSACHCTYKRTRPTSSSRNPTICWWGTDFSRTNNTTPP